MAKRLLKAVIAVELLFTLACGLTPPASEAEQSALEDQAETNGSSVAGQVTDAQSHAPLAGVTVSGGQSTTTSAANGTYRLAIPPGTYTFTATRTGYGTLTRRVAVARRQSTTVNWELQRTTTGTAAVAGRVRDAQSQAPLGGVVVGDGQLSATSASDGTYRLPLSAGPHALVATKSGYVTATQSVTVPTRGTLTVDWLLAAGASSACVYTYSAFGACQTNGTQTRTVLTATPPGCAGTPVLTQPCNSGPPTGTAFKVFAANDLGMHCVDSSYAVLSILPPFNIVGAQVVSLQSSGRPIVLNQTQVDVRFSAVADATGSINSYSIGKSDFWQYALPLYGLALAPGQGLLGMWMPAEAPTVAGRTLLWDSARALFTAPGIPIFPTDDSGNVSHYPLMRFGAFDKAGGLLGSLDVVLPVSDETSCQNCHATGRVAAPAGSIAWSTDPDLEVQARNNVLTLHNANLGTNLRPPVLCAACHYSTALDLAGIGAPSGAQVGHRTSSSVMHSFHANKMTGLADAPVPVGGTPPAATIQSCYQCHPGAVTQCLRGAMTATVTCQNCHGNMAAVGGQYPLLAGGSLDGTNDGAARRAWIDLPHCQSCHAGDAMTRTVVTNPPPLAADGIRFNDAFRTGDLSASPITATNTRFAAEPNKLFRRSKGHGGLQCEACHGSTHAIWAANANDNVAAIQLQGHAGTISECSTCHQSAPTAGLGGPHGMHPVGASWVNDHHDLAGSSQLNSCRACHGADDRGTVLSRMFTTRTLAGRTLTAGTVVGCYTCHNGPSGD